jgi:hypothetical protein
VSASLISSHRIDRPHAGLNTKGDYPFATVDFTEDRRTYFAVRTPSEARALEEQFGKAAVLLERSAAERGVCAECGEPIPGHSPVTCPLNPGQPPAAQAAAGCPDHGTAFEYKRSDGGQEFWGCPAEGCKRGRWVS